MWQWLRRSFVAGFFVTVPLVVSVVALVWVFRLVFSLADRMTSGLGERLFGLPLPGLAIVVTAGLVLMVGAVTRNVLGRRVFRRGEELLLHVPLFRTIYAPVKQLVVAFSPDNALVLLPDLRNEELRFVERASRKELARVKLAGKGPQGIIFTPDGRHAFLSYSTAGKVAIIDIAGWRIAGEIPAGETPDGVAYSTTVLPKR